MLGNNGAMNVLFNKRINTDNFTQNKCKNLLVEKHPELSLKIAENHFVINKNIAGV